MSAVSAAPVRNNLKVLIMVSLPTFVTGPEPELLLDDWSCKPSAPGNVAERRAGIFDYWSNTEQ
jgi:hypothetical protein